MAGVKGKSGGVRSGAGRKPKAPANHAAAVKVEMEPQPHGGGLKRSRSAPVEIEPVDMLTLLQNIALGKTDASAGQIRAAIAAVQYTHLKKGDGGKKDEVAGRAKKAGGGKFASAAPPKLVAAGGKKV